MSELKPWWLKCDEPISTYDAGSNPWWVESRPITDFLHWRWAVRVGKRAIAYCETKEDADEIGVVIRRAIPPNVAKVIEEIEARMREGLPTELLGYCVNWLKLLRGEND